MIRFWKMKNTTATGTVVNSAAASLRGYWVPWLSCPDASCATPLVRVVRSLLWVETMKWLNSFHEPWNGKGAISLLPQLRYSWSAGPRSMACGSVRRPWVTATARRPVARCSSLEQCVALFRTLRTLRTLRTHGREPPVAFTPFRRPELQGALPWLRQPGSSELSWPVCLAARTCWSVPFRVHRMRRL